ncbi:MAG: type II secretion system F family protein, partial [Lentisphaeria bacterium]|nr:type II secretion system F family protein [Lentisphaeria bacterium]
MGLYKYLASSGRDKPSEVLIEADNQNEALSKLRSRRLIPIQYLGEASMNGKGKLQLFGNSGIDTFAFTRQLSPLLSSYIPLERALAIIAEGSDDPRQKSFVNNMRQGLHEGKKFSELIRSQGSLFPDYYANLIESGEESGCLPEVLVQLYKFMGETRDLKGFIVSNSIYPAVILSIVLIVVILMFTVFV